MSDMDDMRDCIFGTNQPGPTPVDKPIVEKMREVGKDPIRPTQFSRMNPRQIGEQMALGMSRIREALVALGQITAAERHEMPDHEVLANAAAQLEAKVAARADYEQFTRLQGEQNTIVKFLRENYSREIAAGRHSSLTFPQVVCGYLENESRSFRAWLRRLFL